MRSLPIIVALAGSIACASSAHAQQATADQLVSFATDPSRDYSAKWRAQFIGLLKRYCEEFLRALPREAPKEKEGWLVNDLNATDDKIIDQLTRRDSDGSRQARSGLNYVFQFCRIRTSSLDQLYLGYRINPKTIDTRKEVVELIRIAILFEDNNTLSTYAETVGVSAKEWKLSSLDAVRMALMEASVRALERK